MRCLVLDQSRTHLYDVWAYNSDSLADIFEPNNLAASSCKPLQLHASFIMGNVDVIAYNVATFISTLFLLEFGADKFVDHTAIVAKRTGIPATTIALLTAGAEWEEVSETTRVIPVHIQLMTGILHSLSLLSHLLSRGVHPWQWETSSDLPSPTSWEPSLSASYSTGEKKCSLTTAREYTP